MAENLTSYTKAEQAAGQKLASAWESFTSAG